MDARQIKTIVDDFHQLGGNSYKLATLVAEAQKESDAQVIETAGHQDLADQVRSN